MQDSAGRRAVSPGIPRRDPLAEIPRRARRAQGRRLLPARIRSRHRRR